VQFVVLALAAKEIGKCSLWIGLPMISGFLLSGVLAGPYGLGLLGTAAIPPLGFIDEIALAFIAFAAGSELELTHVRSSLRTILAILLGQTVVLLIMGTLAYLLLADYIPFMQGMPYAVMVSVALIGATIMVARSPSSALAIIKELRSRGPFTQIALGVTVLMDAVVIIVFTVNVSLADVLIKGANFHFALVLYLGFEIAVDIVLGLLIGQVLRLILTTSWHSTLKTLLVLMAGYGLFYVSDILRGVHLGPLPVGIFSEPLLIGLVAGFIVANYTRYRAELHKIIEDAAPWVFLAFFFLVGLSLEMDVLRHTWIVALILLVVRLIGIYIGCLAGSQALGNMPNQNIVLGMTSITQAGVSIGLAKQVGVEFPAWGNEFATLAIGVIVLNQLIGPPCFKWALHLAGEAHPPADTPEFDGVRDVLICGVDEQSLALARLLKRHNWQVQLADIEAQRIERLVWPEVVSHTLGAVTPEALRAIGIEKVDVMVVMLDDETNYRLCELAYEQFGTAHVVARLYDQANAARFQALGVLTIHPNVSMINLLDHCVRSPSAASLILGQEVNQDVIEVTLGNRALRGLALRDLALPVDTLIVSIRRHGRMLLSHGYTRLELGDEVTVVGSPESLEEVQWQFESFSRPLRRSVSE
jgi:Trk K+ transport system NAD-binding subunit/NhaP-type Na+/H+ or K+/H+ antiporter